MIIGMKQCFQRYQHVNIRAYFIVNLWLNCCHSSQWLVCSATQQSKLYLRRLWSRYPVLVCIVLLLLLFHWHFFFFINFSTYKIFNAEQKKAQHSTRSKAPPSIHAIHASRSPKRSSSSCCCVWRLVRSRFRRNCALAIALLYHI